LSSSFLPAPTLAVSKQHSPRLLGTDKKPPNAHNDAACHVPQSDVT